MSLQTMATEQKKYPWLQDDASTAKIDLVQDMVSSSRGQLAWQYNFKTLQSHLLVFLHIVMNPLDAEVVLAVMSAALNATVKMKVRLGQSATFAAVAHGPPAVNMVYDVAT